MHCVFGPSFFVFSKKLWLLVFLIMMAGGLFAKRQEHRTRPTFATGLSKCCRDLCSGGMVKCLRIRKFGRKLLALLGGVGLNGGEKQVAGKQVGQQDDVIVRHGGRSLGLRPATPLACRGRGGTKEVYLAGASSTRKHYLVIYRCSCLESSSSST